MTEASQLQLAGEASRLLKAEQDDKALAILDRLVDAFPDHEEIVASRAYCLGKLGRFEEAYAVCDELSASNHTQRVEQLRTFLDARQASQSKTDHPAAPPNKVLFPTLTVTSDESSRALANKLDAVRQNLEQEFQQFQKRELEAESTINKLQQRLRNRESSLADTKEQNERLERLLADISTEVAELQVDTDTIFNPAPPLTLHEPDPVLEEAEKNIQILEQRIIEKDETLSAMFRKNADLEKSLSDLKIQKNDLANELDETLSQVSEAEITQGIVSQENTLKERDTLINALEMDKASLHEQMEALQSVLKAGEEEARQERNHRLSLEEAIKERDELLDVSAQDLKSIQNHLETLQQHTLRFHENDTLGAKQLEEVTILVNDRKKAEEELQAANVSLDEELDAVRGDRDALRNTQSTQASTLQHVSEDFEDARNRIADLEQKFTESQEALTKKSSLLDDLQSNLQETISDSDSHRQTIESQLSQTELDLNHKESIIQALEEDLREKALLIEEQTSLLDDNVVRIKELTTAMEDSQATVLTAETRISELESDFEIRNQEAIISEGQSQSLVLEQEKLQSRIQNLLCEKESLTASLQERNVRIASLTEIRTALSDESASTSTLLQDTQTALEESQAEASSLAQELKVTLSSLESSELENKTLLDNISAVKAEVATLNGQLENMQTEIQQLKLERDDESQINEVLRKEFTDLHITYEELQQRYNETETLLSERTGFADTLQETLADKENIIQTITLAKEKLGNELSESVEKISEHLQLEEKAAQIISDQQQQLQDRKLEIQNLQDSKQALEDTLQQVNADLEKAHQSEINSKLQINGLLEEEHRLETALAHAEDVITENNTRVTELTTDAKHAAISIETLRESESELETKQESLLVKLGEVEEHDTHSRERIHELEHFLDETRRQKDEITSELATARMTLMDLEERLLEIEHSSSSLAYEKEDLLKERDKLVEELRQAETKNEKATLSITELTNSVEELEHQAIQTKSNLQDAQSALQNREGELEKQVASLEKAHNETDMLRQALDRVQPELKHMRSKELPEALEQKVRALREVQMLRAEVELLRRQLW